MVTALKGGGVCSIALFIHRFHKESYTCLRDIKWRLKPRGTSFVGRPASTGPPCCELGLTMFMEGVNLSWATQPHCCAAKCFRAPDHRHRAGANRGPWTKKRPLLAALAKTGRQADHK